MDVWVVEKDEEWIEADHFRQCFEIMGYYDSEEKAKYKADEYNIQNDNELNCHGKLVYSFKKITVE